MLCRYFFLTLLFPFTLLDASCIPESRTEIKEGVVQLRKIKRPFEGCIVRFYPDGRKKSELFYRKGKPTGEGRQWYENGQKESEVVYRSGKVHTRKLWNTEGYMYVFERYRDGELLQPVELDYHQAVKACKKATFDGKRDWKLPSVKELYRVPFSEATKEMTFIASNPPKKGQNIEEVSYVRFGSAPAIPRWDSDDLAVTSTFNVICVRAKNPREFSLVMGIGGKAELTLNEIDTNAKAAAPKPVSAAAKGVTPQQAPVAEKKRIKQKTLRPGYYITVYTFTLNPPGQAKLDNILSSGYRYKFSEFTQNGKTMTRVVVGPFPSEKKAQKELKRVHLKIKPDAYIIDNSY